MTNKTYDFWKYIAIQVVPALDVLLIAIGEIWNLPVMDKLAATVAALGVFLGAILIKSTKIYKAESIQTSFNTEDLEDMLGVDAYETENESTEE